MHAEVHHGVEQIAAHKSSSENKSNISDQQVEDSQKQTGNHRARKRWHKETMCITGILMVVAVHHVVESHEILIVRNEMKYVTVQQVLSEGPAKETDEVQPNDVADSFNSSQLSAIQEDHY